MTITTLLIGLGPAEERERGVSVKEGNDRGTIHWGKTPSIVSSTRNRKTKVFIREDVVTTGSNGYWVPSPGYTQKQVDLYQIPYMNLQARSAVDGSNTVWFKRPDGKLLAAVCGKHIDTHGVLPYIFYFNMGQRSRVGPALIGDAVDWNSSYLTWPDLLDNLKCLDQRRILEVKFQATESADGHGYSARGSIKENHEGTGDVYQQLISDEWIISVRDILPGDPDWDDRVFPVETPVDIVEEYVCEEYTPEKLRANGVQVRGPAIEKVGYKKVEPKIRQWWKGFYESWTPNQKQLFSTKDKFVQKSGEALSKVEMVQKLIEQKCPLASLFADLTPSQQQKLCGGLAQWEEVKSPSVKPTPKAIQVATQALQAGKQQQTTTRKKGSMFSDE